MTQIFLATTSPACSDLGKVFVMSFKSFCSGYRGIWAVFLATLSANMVQAQTNVSTADQQTNQPATRTLRPNDQISVSVYQEPDLDVKQIAIDERGTVILPLLGSVEVGGLTVEEATKRVRDLYNKDYLVDPQVSVTLDQFAIHRSGSGATSGKLRLSAK